MNEPHQTASSEPRPGPRPDWREDPASSGADWRTTAREAGWTSGFEDYDLGAGEGGRMPDFAPVFALLDALGRLVPPELQHQFNMLVREVLKTLRAVIDWYLERLEDSEREPEIEDIPIDFD